MSKEIDKEKVTDKEMEDNFRATFGEDEKQTEKTKEVDKAIEEHKKKNRSR